VRARSRPRRRGLREMIWTSASIPSLPTGVNNVEALIVTPGDWTNEAGFAKGAVLKRIRGSFSIILTDAAAAATTQMFAAICMRNTAEVIAPVNINTYVQEDVLWSWTTNLNRAGQWGAGANPNGLHWVDVEVDVKSQRKLTTNTEVVFLIAQTAVAPGGNIAALFRGLIERP